MARIIVQLRWGTEPDGVAASLGATVAGYIPQIRMARLMLPEGMGDTEAVERARQHPTVEGAYFDREQAPVGGAKHGSFAQGIPETWADQEWYLKRAEILQAWQILADYGLGQGAGVSVGVYDSSIFGVAGFEGYIPEVDYIFRPVSVSVSFTVGPDGRVSLPVAPDLGNYAARNYISVKINNVARSRVTADPVQSGQYRVDTKPFTYTSLPGSVFGGATVTVNEELPTLVFNTEDAGRPGTAIYYDRRLISTQSWGSDPYDLYDPSWAMNPSGVQTITESHAVAVLGLLAGKRQVGTGNVRGVAPDCRVMFANPGPAWDPTGQHPLSEDWFATAAAWCWMVDRGARVFSSSNCPNVPSNPATCPDGQGIALYNAGQYIWDHGGIMCVAASNDKSYWDDNTPWHGLMQAPQLSGNMPHCLAIGAMDPWDGRWHNNYYYPSQGSNYGPKIDIASPGLCQLTTVSAGTQAPLSQYSWFGHTSGAAPIAAGVCVLALSANPALTNVQLRDLVKRACSKPVGPGHLDPTTAPEDFFDVFPNAGVLNAAKAVLGALSLRADNAGVVFPYVGFNKLPSYGSTPIEIDYMSSPFGSFPPPTTNVGDGPWNLTTIAGGVATTTLNGSIAVDLDAFCTDPIDHVELWFDGDVAPLYSGPRARLTCTASSSGTPRTLTVKAFSSTGGSAAKSYDSGLVVASLTVNSSASALTATASTSGGVTRVSGSRPGNEPVAVTCPTATVGTVTYPTLYTYSAPVSGLQPGTNTFTASAARGGVATATVSGSIDIFCGTASMALTGGVPAVARTLVSVAGSMMLRGGSPFITQGYPDKVITALGTDALMMGGAARLDLSLYSLAGQMSLRAGGATVKREGFAPFQAADGSRPFEVRWFDGIDWRSASVTLFPPT